MYQIKKTNYGITVITEKIPFVRTISFGIWIKSGSRYEDESINGISHFIEHMMFKGTERFNSKELANEMDSVGGQINAFTSKEYTCFYTVTIDTHFEKSLDILSDMLLNSVYDSEEIEKEKKVVYEEISMYEDTPDEVAYDQLQSLIWPNSSLARPILGKEETLSALDRDKIVKYIEENYSADNIVLSIAGNFDEENLFDKLEKYFGKVKKNYKEENQQNLICEYKSNFVHTYKDIEQIHMCMGLEGVPLGSKDVYSLAVMNTIFGGGVSSRLFQKIREDKGLAYSVYSYTSSYVGTGLFTIYAAMNTVETKQGIQSIIEELNLLKQKNISEEDIQKTKEQIKTNLIIGLENTSSRMSSNGKAQLMLGNVKTPDEIIENIDKVDKVSVNNIINKIIDLDKLSISIVGNTNNIDVEGIKDIWNKR